MTTPRPDSAGRRFTTHGVDRAQALEGVSLASFRRRASALAIDLLLMLLAWALFLFAYAGFMHLSGRWAHGETHRMASNEGLGHGLLLGVGYAYCTLGLWLGGGRTPGKRLVGIRVLSLHRERLGLWTAVERTLGYAASMLEFGFGFLQYFLHPNRQTVHDRIAETIVVNEP